MIHCNCVQDEQQYENNENKTSVHIIAVAEALLISIAVVQCSVHSEVSYSTLKITKLAYWHFQEK